MENPSFMLHCFDLARRAHGANLSNPMVGAVLEYQGKIIGEGYHEKYGGPHAEINALNSVAESKRQYIPASTLYVSLEPCSHHGKTPPCVDAIIKHRIQRVVIGCQDPNPQVGGKGIAKLKEAGIEVILSKKKREAEWLIGPFLAHLQKRPYIILKCVKSQDNYIGQTGQKIWLSNPATTRLSHLWRSQIDGILVGKNTVLIDNPQLTVRSVSGKNPTRIIMDSSLSCPEESAVFQNPGQIIVANRIKEEVSGSRMYLRLENGPGELGQFLAKLYAMGLYTILVEGGANTLTHFIREDLWDEARVIDTPHILGEGIAAPNIEGILERKQKIQDNTVTVIRQKLRPFPHEKGL